MSATCGSRRILLGLPTAIRAQTPSYDVCPRGNPFNFRRADLEATLDELSSILQQFRALATSRLAGEIRVAPQPRSIEDMLRMGRRIGLPEDLQPPIPLRGGPTRGATELVDLDAALAVAADALQHADVPSPSDRYLDLRMQAAALNSSLSLHRPDTRFLLLEIVVLEQKVAAIQRLIFAMLDGRDAWRCLKGYSGLLDVHFNLHDGTDQTPEDFFDESVETSGHARFRAAIDALWDAMVAPSGAIVFTPVPDDVDGSLDAFEPLVPFVERGAAFVGKSAEILRHTWSTRLEVQAESAEAYQIINDTFWPNVADFYGNLEAYQVVIDGTVTGILSNIDALEDLKSRQSSMPEDEFEQQHVSLALQTAHAMVAAATDLERARDNFFADPGFHDQIDDRASAFRAPIEDGTNALVLRIQADQGDLADLQQFIADFCANIQRGITGCGS
jgi:hypothetical protein